MACNILNLARHTCIASIDLTNFYKRHSIQNISTHRGIMAGKNHDHDDGLP